MSNTSTSLKYLIQTVNIIDANIAFELKTKDADESMKILLIIPLIFDRNNKSICMRSNQWKIYEINDQETNHNEPK